MPPHSLLRRSGEQARFSKDRDMIGRLAATTLALALCAAAAEAAPQALRGSIGGAPAEDTASESVAPARQVSPRRSERRARAPERVLVVPANAVLAAPAAAPGEVVPPRRPRARVAAPSMPVAAVPAEAVTEQAVVAPEARVPVLRGRRRAARVPARSMPVAGVPVEATAVSAAQVVVAPAPSAPVVRGSRRAARVAARSIPATAVPVEAVAVPGGEVVEVPEAAPVLRGGRGPARVWIDRGAPVVTSRGSDLEARIAAHSQATGVPADLIHHVITRESRYNPGAIGRGGVYGLMQIKHGTARALGYSGSASGLLDPETNLTYGVRYLAGAYKVANGNPSRAYSLFRSGYYYHAKRQGVRAMAYAAGPDPAQTASVTSAPSLGDALSRIFAAPTQPEPAR
jgi:soluble lytic murein transglycosylase-like protein